MKGRKAIIALVLVSTTKCPAISTNKAPRFLLAEIFPISEEVVFLGFEFSFLMISSLAFSWRTSILETVTAMDAVPVQTYNLQTRIKF